MLGSLDTASADPFHLGLYNVNLEQINGNLDGHVRTQMVKRGAHNLFRHQTQTGQQRFENDMSIQEHEGWMLWEFGMGAQQ